MQFKIEVIGQTVLYNGRIINHLKDKHIETTLSNVVVPHYEQEVK